MFHESAFLRQNLAVKQRFSLIVKCFLCDFSITAAPKRASVVFFFFYLAWILSSFQTTMITNWTSQLLCPITTQKFTFAFTTHLPFLSFHLSSLFGIWFTFDSVIAPSHGNFFSNTQYKVTTKTASSAAWKLQIRSLFSCFTRFIRD